MKKVTFKQQLLIELGITIVLYLLFQTLMSLGIINSYWKGIVITICINVILTVSLNITSGFLGELALGHAGFMAAGAYMAAVFSKSIALIPSVEFPLALLVGGLFAMLLGYLVSIPTLRLRGDYLAIITLAFGEIVRNVLLNIKLTGGAGGYSSIPKYTTFTWTFFIAAACVLLSKSLINSRQGRAIISIREDEIAAEASGINTNYYKKLAFIFSSFFAGVAGALYAHYMGFLQPAYFNLDKSIEILVMCVLGGMGNIMGSIISASILTILPEALRQIADYRMLVYAIVLIVMMLVKYAPQFEGILNIFKPKKEEEA